MVMTNELIREMIWVGLRSIRSNLLRTALTVSVIGLGIMALISMTTATSSLEATVEKQFSSLGTNAFTFQQKVQSGLNRGQRVKLGLPISFRECQQFVQEAPADLKVTYSIYGTSQETLTRGSERTNPNISVLGIDHRYIGVQGFELEAGRSFSQTEAESGYHALIVGADIVEKLFEPWETPVGNEISLGSQRYMIIGVLKRRGQSFGMSQDNQCLIPVPCIRQQYAVEDRSYNITCKVEDTDRIKSISESAMGVMRIVRGDRPGQENSFTLTMSNSLISTLKEATEGITIAASFIGIITLFGAGIGLMNIMLVSVAERTREIGTRKAIGASPSAIRIQFLVEVIIIGQIGGLTGTVLGLLVGNGIAIFLETPFVMPWGWIAIGLLLSFLTSVASGYYPARKAALLDPIVALGRV